MKMGTLRSSGDSAVYWFPEDRDIDFMVLTKKNIESRGGVILDERYPVGFIAKKRPACGYCRTCEVMITKL